MLYHILGAVSSALFLLTWYGLYKQLTDINKAKLSANQSTISKPDSAEPETYKSNLSTANLSTNQFTSSFFAFYANFIFGIAIDPFNHYLVWTRLGALVLLAIILFEMFQARKNVVSGIAFYSVVFALIVGFISMFFRPFPELAKLATNGFMLVVTLILIQGTFHQYWLLHKSNTRGNLSFSLMNSILIKDISTLAFALTMPIEIAWPLLVLNGSSVVFRGLLLVKMHRVNNLVQS